MSSNLLSDYEPSSSGSALLVEQAERIYKILKLNNGPMGEKKLKKKAEVTSIGEHFAYLGRKYGVLCINNEWNGPDDDNKIYVLPGRVRVIDQRGYDTLLSEVVIYNP